MRKANYPDLSHNIGLKVNWHYTASKKRIEGTVLSVDKNKVTVRWQSGLVETCQDWQLFRLVDGKALHRSVLQ
jgi:hypothetical protein